MYVKSIKNKTFLKFIPKKDIYKKFKEFLYKQTWREIMLGKYI